MLAAMQAHIDAEIPGDRDHSALLALFVSHVESVNAAHERLMRALDIHIEASDE